MSYAEKIKEMIRNRDTEITRQRDLISKTTKELYDIIKEITSEILFSEDCYYEVVDSYQNISVFISNHPKYSLKENPYFSVMIRYDEIERKLTYRCSVFERCHIFQNESVYILNFTDTVSYILDFFAAHSQVNASEEGGK